MQKIPDWVIDKLSPSNEKTLVTNMFYLMKELHVSYDELCEMPVPAIMMLLNELSEHGKREEKAMKKKR